tara:strand:- start:3855 stop:4382 length:528 start_codon:yes stop_codon:yes gene_type:complete
MDMPDTDKRNPKGRKLDKNGNPIVTKEELEKSGMSLRDFLNKERGLTRRKDAPATAARNTPLKQTPRQPSLSQAMDKPVGMKDDARRDKRGDFPGEGAAKSMAAEGGAGAAAAQEARKRGPSDADIKRAKAMTAKAQEEKYGSGLKTGGKVKGYKTGGSVKGYGKARGGRTCKIV